MKPGSPLFLWLSVIVVRLVTPSLVAQEMEILTLITTNARLQPAIETVPPHNATVLWNGRDLTGWKSFFTNANVDVSTVWLATNGALRLSGRPFGYLHTQNSFSNYHLHVEWRWPVTNGNSGVFVHFDGVDAIWPVSVECQLGTGSAGELIGLGGVDFPAPTLNNRKRAKIVSSHEKPLGEWNAYDIYCRSNTITVDVNGFRKNTIDNVSVSSGGIGLQLEGQVIEFRNIWLEPI
jgi:hypothetical protein